MDPKYLIGLYCHSNISLSLEHSVVTRIFRCHSNIPLKGKYDCDWPTDTELAWGFNMIEMPKFSYFFI